MARTAAEQQAYDEGKADGATKEQITTLFDEVKDIKQTQQVILKKVEELHSFKAIVLSVASAVSLVISVGASFLGHWLKEVFK